MRVKLDTSKDIEDVISMLWQDMVDGEVRTITYYMATHNDTGYTIVDNGDTVAPFVNGCVLSPVAHYDNAYITSKGNSVVLAYERHQVGTATVIMAVDNGEPSYMDRLEGITVLTTDNRFLSLGEWADEWEDRQIARDLENSELEL